VLQRYGDFEICQEVVERRGRAPGLLFERMVVLAEHGAVISQQSLLGCIKGAFNQGCNPDIRQIERAIRAGIRFGAVVLDFLSLKWCSDAAWHLSFMKLVVEELLPWSPRFFEGLLLSGLSDETLTTVFSTVCSPARLFRSMAPKNRRSNQGRFRKRVIDARVDMLERLGIPIYRNY